MYLTQVFLPESVQQDQLRPAYKVSKVMLNRAVELSSEPLLAMDGIKIVAGNPGTTK